MTMKDELKKYRGSLKDTKTALTYQKEQFE